MPRLLALLLLAFALVAAGCGDDDDEGAAKSPSTQAGTPAETAGCEKVAAPQPKGEQNLERPKGTLAKGKTHTAVVETSCGTFEIQLAAARAPKTAASFAGLAGEGFFDDLTFHRIVPDFVIQGGDPQGDGSGGPGYSVTEAPPKDLKYTRGVVAMAKTEIEDAGTSGSQFFVVTGEDAGLPADYALLGRVTKGMEVVDRIAAVPTDPQTDAPVDPVVIKKVTVDES